MPNAKDNAKASGDTHLPEIEADEFGEQGAHPEGTGTEGTQARERSPDGVGSPGRGGRHAGVLKDREAPTSDSYGDTRDSGEG